MSDNKELIGIKVHEHLHMLSRDSLVDLKEQVEQGLTTLNTKVRVGSIIQLSNEEYTIVKHNNSGNYYWLRNRDSVLTDCTGLSHVTDLLINHDQYKLVKY